MWRLFRRTRPVTEMASEVREGLENVADAVRTVAGALASIAAGMHTTNSSDQRDMAGVIYTDATERFADPLKKLDAKKRAELESFINGLCKAKK